MPVFAPVRVRGGGKQRLRRAVLRWRRAAAAGLAMVSTALAVAGVQAEPATPAAVSRGTPAEGCGERQRATGTVSAPVRIADAETVRLLHPGDHVDVIAAADASTRVVAAGARVAEVHAPREPAADGGALVVLSVPRATAAKLVGAGATERLAVTLC
ncbi:hypothetical protein GCM10020367_27580 [Streptomyces sannanensis]|uniref:Flp pilus assembly protein RcpC/CpaB domain-containing protein n=1 Tax=Streptomyces sannanensis TaxID=285536 RepID=A0ABP6SAZ2_9ACTN